MKRSVWLLVLTAIPLLAQTPPGEKRMISRSVNHWVATASQGGYDVDYVYVGDLPGLSLHPNGRMRVDGDGRCVKLPGPMPEPNMHWMASENRPVIVLSDKCRAELALPERPDLPALRDTTSIQYRIKLAGLLHFPLNDADGGLEILEAAYKENPAAEGLAHALASWSYHDNHEDRALAVAEEAVKRNPKDCDLGHLLGDYLFLAFKTDQAIERYLTTIPLCSDPKAKDEMAVNLAAMYHLRGDRRNEEKWKAFAQSMSAPR